MKVALTGATGFVGSHVLMELQGHGHDVMALVRDDAQAEAVTRRGALPTVVDLYDRRTVAGLLDRTEGAIHRQPWRRYQCRPGQRRCRRGYRCLRWHGQALCRDQRPVGLRG